MSHDYAVGKHDADDHAQAPHPRAPGKRSLTHTLPGAGYGTRGAPTGAPGAIAPGSDGAASARGPLPDLGWRALIGVDLADTDPTAARPPGDGPVDTAAIAADTEHEDENDVTSDGSDDSDGNDPEDDGDEARDDHTSRVGNPGVDASDARPDHVQATGEAGEHHGSNVKPLRHEPAKPEAEATKASSKRRPKSRPPTDSYAIQLRTWIPQKHVADPEKRIRMSSWLQNMQYVFEQYPGLHYAFDSKYRGDGHVGINGTYRVLSRVEFRTDGKRIFDFAHSGDAGTSHRDYSYELYLRLLFGVKVTILKKEFTESATASGSWHGSQTGASGFRMSYAVANPLTIAPAPPVNADVKASISRSGLTLNFDTDRFPSHGIIVFKNGRRIRAQIINNVSGQKTSGALGIANMARGLTSQSNEGRIRSR